MDRYKKYMQEHCKNCKNKKSNLCDIRVFYLDGIVETKCAFYEKENKFEGYKDKIKINVTAKKQKPIMKGIDK